jgi:putative FmdB family regulatory protein
MPLYEYFCKKCDKNFTITMSIAEHEKKKVKCPECREPTSPRNSGRFTQRPLERAKLFNRPGAEFKGPHNRLNHQ